MESFCERQPILISGDNAMHDATRKLETDAYRLDVENGEFYECIKIVTVSKNLSNLREKDKVYVLNNFNRKNESGYFDSHLAY